MKFAHTITLSVFAKHQENAQSLEEALTSAIPLNLTDEKITLKKTIAEGFEHKITILELTLTKERHTAKFISFLKEKLGTAQVSLLRDQENRVDEDCFFYLRLDKQKLLLGEYQLTDSGDCFHIKMSIAAFPKNRIAALDVVKKMLS